MDSGSDMERDYVPGNKRWRRRLGRLRGHRSPPLRTATAISILIIWAGSTVFDITSAQYDPPEGLNTIALAAATYLFGSAFLQENKGHDDHEEEEDK